MDWNEKYMLAISTEKTHVFQPKIEKFIEILCHTYLHQPPNKYHFILHFPVRQNKYLPEDNDLNLSYIFALLERELRRRDHKTENISVNCTHIPKYLPHPSQSYPL